MKPEDFLIGLHMPNHLESAGVPAFVSDTRLRGRKSYPRSLASFGVDSGGFTQLQEHGTWTITPKDYVVRLRRYASEMDGPMLWAAPQDWMCEDEIINGGWHHGRYYAGTHKAIHEHHVLTVDNWVELKDLAPELNIIPVVQGKKPEDYLRCAELYWTRHRIDLTTLPLVGVGSVCRRQHMDEAGEILRRLNEWGLTRLHGFGFKTLGLLKYGHLLVSADSMAWSDDARKIARRRPGAICGTIHPKGGKTCANCLPYALQWRARLLNKLEAQHGKAGSEVRTP